MRRLTTDDSKLRNTNVHSFLDTDSPQLYDSETNKLTQHPAVQWQLHPKIDTTTSSPKLYLTGCTIVPRTTEVYKSSREGHWVLYYCQRT
eukprot:m.24960 g.24960  ORF g.24960 m.24960 type:complete len:90 (+) comp13126_c0_seq1:216-485(+)